MSRKGLYLAVGFLWAVLLGVGAGFAAAAFAAGAAWLYLFGDSDWPAWTSWAIPGFGLIVGLVTFAALMAVTRMVAGRQEASANSKTARTGGTVAWILLPLGLAVAGGLGWQFYGETRDFEQARERATVADRYFTEMLAAAHRITEVAVDWPGGGRDGHAAVRLDGQRTGDYRLEWQVTDRAYEKPLLRGDRALPLTAGTQSIDVVLPAGRIVEGYRTLLNRREANVLVDEPFELEVVLAPVPSPEEISRMPPREARNLANGWSPLIRRARATFAVRFVLHGETPSWR